MVKMSKKEHRGDRKDGVWLRDLDSLHTFLPYLYPNRTDNEAFIRVSIDLTAVDAYLDHKNSTIDTPVPYKMFHLLLTALAKAVTLRPKMNRFIQGDRIYQRNDLTAAFMVKKQFTDDSDEAMAFIKFAPEDTIDTVHERLVKEITTCRGDQLDNSTASFDSLCRLPRWMIRIIMGGARRLNYHGHMPDSMIKTDPNHSTIFATNLGSIGLQAGYHHLSNFGTNSIFLIVGKAEKKPVLMMDGSVEVRHMLEIGLTIDERIADGFYYAGTVKLVQHLMAHPELLDQPLSTPVELPEKAKA